MSCKKTVTLTGTEQKVEIKGRHCDIRNDGTGVVYVSCVPGIVPDADGVLSVPAGQAVKYCGCRGVVYLLGTGKVQLCGNDYSSPVFKYAAAPSGVGGVTGDNISIANSANFPLLALSMYGKSTQDGTPTPDTPIDIVNVGDSGSVVVTVNDGGENSLSASLTSALPLCGIPVTSGGNYTDSKGQQWICDELVYRPDGTGKIVKNCVKFVPDTVSGFTLLADGTTFRISFICPIPHGNGSVRRKTLCSHAAYDVDWVKVNCFCYLTSNGVTDKLLIQIPASLVNATTKEGAQEWLDNNKVVFTYALATPEEIELTAEEMVQLKALYSYSGVTNISNDAGAEMAVKYCNSALVSEYYLPIVERQAT